jgi:Aldo/keto reductase family/Pyridine nucleotide-disulphide oxidoreductase, dimerisation domain
MWGGSDEGEAIKTIRTALDLGITLIDTAPAYGFGRSEELVGLAIAEHGEREHVRIATKVGLEWCAGRVYRNASAERIRAAVKESLRRLRTDYIDISQRIPRGFLKMLIGARSDEILGFTAFGVEATELMAAVQTAMVGRMPFTMLRDAIFTHPTVSEGLVFLLGRVERLRVDDTIKR